MIAAVLIGGTRFLLGGRARWIGSGAGAALAQCIYFANHTSHLDAFVLWAALPPSARAGTRPVAAADYWKANRLRRHLACRTLGAVLIERGGGAAALLPLADALRNGDSLILFPEGTRHPQPLPAAFHSGLYHLAREFPAVDLVPVYLDNLHRAWPKGTLLPVPVSTGVLFGEPMRVALGEDRNAFLARARAAVVALGRIAHPEVGDA